MAEIIGYRHIKTVEGDTFDGLALIAYDDEFKSGLIMDANPYLCGVLIFEAGVEVRIPILDGAESAETLPPWRR